jgi:hypothetical protein
MADGFSENADSSIVAKYSDRRVRISEWAYIIRLRAVVCKLKDNEAEDERPLMGVSVAEGLLGEVLTAGFNRSRQTNRTSPVSRRKELSTCCHQVVEGQLARIVKRCFQAFK